MAVGTLQGGSTSVVTAFTQLLARAAYDRRDTNQDGVVSPAEAFAYDLKHPETRTRTQAPAAKAPLNGYSRTGAAGSGNAAAPSFSWLA